MISHLEAQEDMLILIIALGPPLLHVQVKENMSWRDGLKTHQKITAVVKEAIGMETHQEAQEDML